MLGMPHATALVLRTLALAATLACAGVQAADVTDIAWGAEGRFEQARRSFGEAKAEHPARREPIPHAHEPERRQHRRERPRRAVVIREELALHHDARDVDRDDAGHEPERQPDEITPAGIASRSSTSRM